MDPDTVSLVIDFSDDSDWDDECDDNDELNAPSAAALEAELFSLRARVKYSHDELESLKLQQTFFDPASPPSSGRYVEEFNESELQGSIRTCEYRLRRLQAQIGNLNRKVILARKAESSGLHVGRALDREERTLFVLVFGYYGEIEDIVMYKRHCLVTFTSRENARKALTINGTKPFGRRLRVRPTLEPYSFATMPLTISFLETPSFFFPFTFSVPRSPSPTEAF